ncbi:aromatic ring-hydroxylating dioxygenase subunit alpha [Frankia sp. AgB1.8]|nr:aromatic ring-hydroxylating dioxygenase subunit alpha [Frankia sp. AgB1.8]
MLSAAESFQAVSNEELAFLGTGPVPTAPYYDREYHELEREAVFRRSWLHVGRVSELTGTDPFLVRRIGVARASVLITRSSDGVLRAFHNVCPHRGNELVAEDAGEARSFSCRYHMWNFGTDGALRAVPDEKRFYDLDWSACGLRPIAVDTCAGFLFVHLDAAPAQSLRESLGPFGDDLERIGFGRFTDFEQYSCDVAANWKTAAHNFQENYHVRWVHRPSSGGRATSRENPFGYNSSFRFHGRHGGGTHWIPAAAALSDVRATAMRAAPTADDAPCRGNFDFFHLFPNLYIEPLGGFNTFTMQFWPLDTERTRLVVRVYRAGDDTSASARFSREYTASSLMDVHVEDVEVIEANQRGLRSGALEHIYFGAQEAVCRQLHENVAEMVRTYLTGRSTVPARTDIR